MISQQIAAKLAKQLSENSDLKRLERANKLLKDLHDVLNGECEDRGNIDCQCEHCNAEIRTFNALDKYLKENK